MRIIALSKICLSVLLTLLLYGISYAPTAAADALPLEATMISLETQNFPFIYLSVAVNRYGEGISTLTRSNFQVTENGSLQTDFFDVFPPDTGGGVRAVDIVFLMDNSGSMGDEQSTVRNHVEAFVDELVARGVDCQLGLCRFGAFENGGNPIIEDNGTLTSNTDYFKNTVWNRNVTSGGFEPGWDALYEAVTSFAFRGGAQKVFILITDETPTDNGNIGTHTQEEAIAILKDHFVTAFALIELSDAHAISDYGEIAQQTNGEYYDILEPLDGILDYISNLIANNYRITYKSSRPVFDGVERHVVVTVSYSGDQVTCEGTYIPGSAPRIQRTQDTLDLHNQPWAAGTQFNIRAEITDAVVPYVQSTTVYYRRTGDANYTPTAMTHSSDIWAGTIPGSAVSSPGVDYYISATDGQSTVTDPSVDPRTSPHQLAILPNEAPRITHTPPADVPINTPVAITAEIIDTTNALASARLHYRKTGQLIYQCNGEMTNTAGDSYRDSIPSDYVTAAGVEYYILAVDDLGVGNYHGTPDVPHVVSVSTNPPPDTKIETADIDSVNGTAKFTWSGSDDTTPATELTYSYRLMRPGPAYDAWSSWNKGTTKTYSGLTPGNYKFQVRAKDADDAIDPSPASREFVIGETRNHPPIAHASDISGQPQTMYPDTIYTVTAKYFDPDGRDDLKICYLQLKHPEKRLTMMWYQEDGHTSTYAGEEGENYLSNVNVTPTDITDTNGNKGYKLTWTFQINNRWPEVENAIDFGVFASDDRDLESGWEYDDTDASFSTKPALNCVIELWPIPGPGSIGVVREYQEFDIYVGGSTGDIGAVRFLGDASLNGSPDGDWTAWLDWGKDTVIGGWDASEKTKEWMFCDFGAKEVWAEIRNASAVVTARCYKHITAEAAPYGPFPYGYKFENSSPKGLTDDDKRLLLNGTFDWGDAELTDLIFTKLKDTIATGGHCYGMVASSLMEYWDPEYDSVLEDHDLPCNHLWYVEQPAIDSGAWDAGDMMDNAVLKQILIFQLAWKGAGWQSYLDYNADPWGLVHKLAAADDPSDYSIIVGYREPRSWLEKLLKKTPKEYVHALAPYRLETEQTEDGGVVRIYVYDPNSPDVDGDGRSNDTDRAHDRFVQIGPGTQTWKYNFSQDWVWPAENATESYLAVVPISAHHYYQDHTPKPGGSIEPQCLAEAERSGSIELLLADDAGRLTGISGDDYFEEIPGVKPVIDCSEASSSGTTHRQAYFVEDDIALTATVRGVDETTYSVTRFGPEFFSSISDVGTSEGSTDTFTFEDDGAELRFSDSEQSRTYDLVLHRTLESGGQTFTATNIPTTAGTVHRYTIDWDALAQGEEGVTVEIDSDGDGIFERIITSDDELLGDEFSEVPTGQVVNNGPNPVASAGTTFFYTLPEGTSTAKLMIFSPSGRLMFETPIDPASTRFPTSGTWNPVDDAGVELANGPYVYVLIADGKVIGQGKMVIQR